MQRSSPGFFRREAVRAKKRPAALSKLSPAIAVKYIRLQFFLMPGPTDRSPRKQEEVQLLEAGMGKRTVTVLENASHDEIVSQLEEKYSKLKNLSGGWLCYKASGGQGQRKLNLVTTESEGYNARLLKNVSINGKHILYVVPLQERLDETPLPHDAPEFERMPKSTCQKCGIIMPLQFLALHITSCNVEDNSDEPEMSSIEEVRDNTTEICPICGQNFPTEDIQFHASFCGDGISANSSRFQDDVAGEGTSGTNNLWQQGSSHTVPQSSTVTVNLDEPEWKETLNASSAATQFRRCLLREQELETPIRFSMDLASDVGDREKAVLAFYKIKRTKWAAPLHCVLEGDAAIGDGVSRYFLSFAMNALQSGFSINFGNADVTMLFEGQKDHLIPCASQPLLDSDLFMMAGRMVGHSFIPGGPGLAGISPAVVHMLLGGQLETATLVLEDCPDLDQRNTIHSVPPLKG
ncbi:uncharacterized protein LOC130378700 [Gadus chalcogrammus]|uniref:uncharacterized protein LOC130378700 n=1 Tax=Gadus chalcogrammus TaxID=1042646 RepID=UPI0024C29C45|nr:uncharacterized protein LOC130378700 [Gadus chalcogrammus]